MEKDRSNYIFTCRELFLNSTDHVTDESIVACGRVCLFGMRRGLARIGQNSEQNSITNFVERCARATNPFIKLKRTSERYVN